MWQTQLTDKGGVNSNFFISKLGFRKHLSIQLGSLNFSIQFILRQTQHPFFLFYHFFTNFILSYYYYYYLIKLYL